MNKVHIAPQCYFVTLCGLNRCLHHLDTKIVAELIDFRKATCKNCLGVWKRNRKLIERIFFGIGKDKIEVKKGGE